MKKTQSRRTLKVRDPRKKQIVCEEAGLAHALQGHPEVTTDKIEECVVDPDYIRQSTRIEESHIYCSVASTDKDVECFFTVVKFNQSYTKGFVVTAYEGIDNSAKGEIIWQRK